MLQSVPFAMRPMNGWAIIGARKAPMPKPQYMAARGEGTFSAHSLIRIKVLPVKMKIREVRK